MEQLVPAVERERAPARALQTNVDVCICTYRRSSVAEAIRAIAAQTGCEAIALRLIVADNAPDTEAHLRIAATARDCGIPLRYVHAPAHNISVARNACLDSATAEWIAFVDDDEVPAPGWLSSLVAEAAQGDWDVVLGPVVAIYSEIAPRWVKTNDFHSARPVWIEGNIETGYAGNVLVRRATVERANLRFRPELGRSGGEDVDFFYRLRDLGARIGFAEAASVYEPVPQERASLSWLMKRRFRAGQTHGARLKMRQPLMEAVAVATAKAAACGVAALLFGFWAERRNRFLARGALHVGVVAKLMGMREITLY